jgi:RNA polymerase sigma-70 factor (family 1)
MEREDEYIRALSEGDEKAFELLFLRYQPKLIYFFTGFVHDEEIARDMAQDLFFNLWINRGKLAGVHSFCSYLYRMARNALYNYYDHTLVLEKYDAAQLFTSLSVSDTEEQFFAKELQDFINLKIEQMPPQRRQIFKMSRVEGLDNEEIALRLNISKRTVESHLSSALADLRKLLGITLSLFL